MPNVSIADMAPKDGVGKDFKAKPMPKPLKAAVDAIQDAIKEKKSKVTINNKKRKVAHLTWKYDWEKQLAVVEGLPSSNSGSLQLLCTLMDWVARNPFLKPEDFEDARASATLPLSKRGSENLQHLTDALNSYNNATGGVVNKTHRRTQFRASLMGVIADLAEEVIEVSTTKGKGTVQLLRRNGDGWKALTNEAKVKARNDTAKKIHADKVEEMESLKEEMDTSDPDQKRKLEQIELEVEEAWEKTDAARKKREYQARKQEHECKAEEMERLMEEMDASDPEQQRKLEQKRLEVEEALKKTGNTIKKRSNQKLAQEHKEKVEETKRFKENMDENDPKDQQKLEQMEVEVEVARKRTNYGQVKAYRQRKRQALMKELFPDDVVRLLDQSQVITCHQSKEAIAFGEIYVDANERKTSVDDMMKRLDLSGAGAKSN